MGITAHGPWYIQWGMVLVAIAIPAVLTVALLWLDKRYLKKLHAEEWDEGPTQQND